jgi:hypothetical protein
MKVFRGGDDKIYAFRPRDTHAGSTKARSTSEARGSPRSCSSAVSRRL